MERCLSAVCAQRTSKRCKPTFNSQNCFELAALLLRRCFNPCGGSEKPPHGVVTVVGRVRCSCEWAGGFASSAVPYYCPKPAAWQSSAVIAARSSVPDCPPVEPPVAELPSAPPAELPAPPLVPAVDPPVVPPAEPPPVEPPLVAPPAELPPASAPAEPPAADPVAPDPPVAEPPASPEPVIALLPLAPPVDVPVAPLVVPAVVPPALLPPAPAPLRDEQCSVTLAISSALTCCPPTVVCADAGKLHASAATVAIMAVEEEYREVMSFSISIQKSPLANWSERRLFPVYSKVVRMPLFSCCRNTC